MNFKKFLKPDWRKIVSFIVLFIVASYFYGRIEVKKLRYLPECGPTLLIGFPFKFLKRIECAPGWGKSGYYWKYEYLLFDLIFFYLFSCFIIWIYD